MNDERLAQYEEAKNRLDDMLLEAIDLLKGEFDSIRAKAEAEPILESLIDLIDNGLDFRKKLDLITGVENTVSIRGGGRVNKRYGA